MVWKAEKPIFLLMHEGSMVYSLVWAVGLRHRLSFRYYQTSSPFEYDLVCFLSTKNGFFRFHSFIEEQQGRTDAHNIP